MKSTSNNTDEKIKKLEVHLMLRKEVHLPVGRKSTIVTAEVLKLFEYDNHTNKKHDRKFTKIYWKVHKYFLCRSKYSIF